MPSGLATPSDRPPHPGPPPEPFTFPFAELAAARAAVAELVADLEHLVVVHESAASFARVGLLGPPRDGFDAGVMTAVGALRSQIWGLRAQLAELDDSAATAHRRAEEHDDALTRWTRQMRAHAEAGRARVA